MGSLVGGPVGSVKFAGFGPWVASTEESDVSFVTSRQLIYLRAPVPRQLIFEGYSAMAAGNDV